MKKYVAKVGTPDHLKQIDSDLDREILVEDANPYGAHKKAMIKLKGTEEVLSITINNVRVYDIVTGFIPVF